MTAPSTAPSTAQGHRAERASDLAADLDTLYGVAARLRERLCRLESYSRPDARDVAQMRTLRADLVRLDAQIARFEAEEHALLRRAAPDTTDAPGATTATEAA